MTHSSLHRRLIAVLALGILGGTAHGQTTVPTSPTRLSAAELALWNNPAFKQRFVQSYVAETEIEPTVTKREVKEMTKVLDYISDDEMDKAATLLEKQRDDGSSAVYDFTLGNIYFQREELDRAVAEYRNAVQKYPKFLRAWRNLGIIHVRQADYDRALPALTRVIELGGGDAVTYGLLGFAYSSVGNELAAESAYRMALLMDPATIDWTLGLARSFFKQARYADAAALCGQLIEDDPERIDYWLLQANAYIGLNKAAKAAENYEIVEALGGSTADSLSMLADIYVNDGLFDVAVDRYISALQMNPPIAPERALRAAKVMAARGAATETGELLDQIDGLFGSSLAVDDRKDLLKLRARVAVANGAGDEEAAILEKIVAIDPLDGEALILLGQHAARNDDSARAVFFYERAAGLEEFEADAKVRHAQLMVKEGKYNVALNLLRAAQQVQPRKDIQDYMDKLERVAKGR